MHRLLLTAAGVILMTILLSWAHLSFALTAPGSPTAFSASLLYIYAADPKYWPGRIGKLLRDNDTLLIVQGLAYKVWCEVLPEGKPRINSNDPNVIAHRPTSRSTLAHVELHRTLFDTLNAMDSAGLLSPKLWCDYTDGVNNMRTGVYLRAFSVANTTCDYTPLSGLVEEGHEVSFTCTALSGYPIPKHRCDIVRDNGVRLPARVKSVTRLGESHVVTTFSLLASRENLGASIECSTSQQITYDGSGRSFDESHTERVPKLGNTAFIFVVESTKNCKINLATGSSSIVVRCQSKGGLPETEHSCHVSGPSAATSVPLITRISEDATHITEVTFSNSRADRNVSVTCALNQGIFYRKNFTFPLPVIANTTCDFAAVNGLIIEGSLVNFTCSSLSGYPVPQHRCDILNEAGTVRESAKVLAVSRNEDDQVVTTFSMLASRANQGAGIDCSTNQQWVNFEDGRKFNQLLTQTIGAPVKSNFTFVLESTKSCGIATASGDGITIQCQSSGGQPATEHACSFTRTNESGTLLLIPKSPKVSEAHITEITFDNTKSHLDTTITCVLKQQSFYSKNIVFQIPGAWNTACDFVSLTGLVTKGSLVNFTCTSRAGYSGPEHKCDIVRMGGAVRVPAQVASTSRLESGLVVTTFSFSASQENQGASIECSTSQPISYHYNGRTFNEPFAKRVPSIGRSNFEFISPSSKQCEMIMIGDYGITIHCRSTGGQPQTEHNCRLGAAYLPTMAKFEGGTYITQTAFNNSWAHQNATVTCTLRQLTYFNQNFTLPIPKFKQSTKTCQFVHRMDGLQATCSSGTGLPSSEHSCIVKSDSVTIVLKQTEATVQNGTVSSTYKVPNDLLIRGSQIVCAIRQMEFPPETYVHSVPRFIESSKSCNFTNSTKEVKVVCEFSHGYPDTYSECQLKTSNSSADIHIYPDKEREEVLGTAAFTVKLQEPEVSPQGGSIIVCRLYQGHLFAKTFVHEIGEYISLPKVAPESTEAPPELRTSNQTVVTLSLVLVAVLLLVLTFSLLIHVVCRCLRRRNHKATAGILEESLTSAASVITTAAPVTRRPRIPPAGVIHQSPAQNVALMQLVLSDYVFRGNRRAGIPDIDQYSLFDLGLELEAGSKRLSVLVDPLLQSQIDQNKKEFRFSM